MKYIEIGSDGTTVNREVMDNGELRTRLISADNSAYIRTEASEYGDWQNSHFHLEHEETYIVQKGWVGLAELVNGCLNLRTVKENLLYTVKTMVPHNLYLPANTIIHTVKHGSVKQGDWHKSKELDVLTKHLSEKNIKTIVGG